jgi:uncharacterized protein (TIGR02246 family)
MKKALLAMFLVPSLALAAEQKATPASDDPMAGWVPPKVKNEAKDKQEIMTMIRGMETASKKGDLEAAAALVDFPVMMMTDDSKGEAMGEPWTREQWVEVMKPFYEKPMKDMKVTRKPNIFLLTDSLASVDDVMTMTHAGKTITSRNSMLVIRRDGKWRVKAMAEGGWGDMMAEMPRDTASGTHETTPGSMGSGAERPGGTQGSDAQPAPGSMGSGAERPAGTQGSDAGAQPPPERTTK